MCICVIHFKLCYKYTHTHTHIYISAYYFLSQFNASQVYGVTNPVYKKLAIFTFAYLQLVGWCQPTVGRVFPVEIGTAVRQLLLTLRTRATALAPTMMPKNSFADQRINCIVIHYIAFQTTRCMPPRHSITDQYAMMTKKERSTQAI